MVAAFERFTWWWVLGGIVSALLAATLASVLIQFMAKRTWRRTFDGGISEVVIRRAVALHGWLILVAVLPLGVDLILNGALLAGILTLVGPTLIAALQLPFDWPLSEELFAKGRLRAHLWRHRHDLKQETTERRHARKKLLEELDELVESRLDAEDLKIKRHVDAVYTIQKHRLWHHRYGMIDEAIRSINLTSQFTGHHQDDSRAMEFLYLFAVSLGLACCALGVGQAAANGMVRTTVILLGGGSLVLAVLGEVAVRWWRSTFFCLVCGENTRRRMWLGDEQLHICSQECRQTLRRIFDL